MKVVGRFNFLVPAQLAQLELRSYGIEAEIQRLTAHTEELENRIELVVADGTMRIGDLEFRLVELEGGDLAALEHQTTLGGDPSVEDAVVDGPTPAADGPELALGEKEDFDRALEAYEAEDYAQAVSLFEAFNTNYPSGPLSGAAHLYRGLP